MIVNIVYALNSPSVSLSFSRINRTHCKKAQLLTQNIMLDTQGIVQFSISQPYLELIFALTYHTKQQRFSH